MRNRLFRMMIQISRLRKSDISIGDNTCDKLVEHDDDEFSIDVKYLP